MAQTRVPVSLHPICPVYSGQTVVISEQAQAWIQYSINLNII